MGLLILVNPKLNSSYLLPSMYNPILNCSWNKNNTNRYQEVTGEGEALTSQERVKVPPTLAAEPISLRPNVGEVRVALHARTDLVREPWRPMTITNMLLF